MVFSKMKDDAHFNIKFVQAVEKHPCLYNNTLAEYSRKDISDRAWNMVAEEINETVMYCKEKWKNLRSVFVRTLKPQPFGTQKFRKPYYLNDVMKFILPYVKTTPTLLDVSEPLVSPIPYEEADDPLANTEGNQDELEILETDHDPCCKSSEIRALKKRKKNYDFSSSDCNKPAQKSDFSPRKMFLLGLVPEVNDLTEPQMRLFRRKVLQLIDELRAGVTNYTDSNSVYFSDVMSDNSCTEYCNNNQEQKNEHNFHMMKRKLFKENGPSQR